MGLTKPLQSLFLSLALSLAAAGLAAPAATAAELIMLERPGCGWCLRWNQEIAPEYSKTAEGRQAFRERLSVDAASWARGRGWALWKTLATCSSTYKDPEDAGEFAIAKRILAEIFREYAG